MVKYPVFLILSLAVFCQAFQDIPAWNYGPVSLYPADASKRLYRLPFDSGVTHECTGGYGSDPNSGYKHPDYSVDFDMGQGETILAVRGGIVSQTYTRNMDTVCNIDGSPGNSLAIFRVDTIIDTTLPSGKRVLRTYDYYLHIKLDPIVKPGDTVVQGQPLALASCTGLDGGGPHIHFKVMMPPHQGYFPSNTSYFFNSIPTPFVEITDVSNGLPELYHTYISQNKRAAPIRVERLAAPAVKASALSFSPNPAMGSTVLRFASDQSAPAIVAFYDLKGRQVNTGVQVRAVNGAEREYGVDLGDLPNGVYVCRVKAGKRIMAERIAIIR